MCVCARTCSYACVTFILFNDTERIFINVYNGVVFTIITNNSSDRIDPLLTTPEASGVPLDVSAPLCVLLKPTGDGCNYQSVVAGNEKNKLK